MTCPRCGCKWKLVVHKLFYVCALCKAAIKTETNTFVFDAKPMITEWVWAEVAFDEFMQEHERMK